MDSATPETAPPAAPAVELAVVDTIPAIVTLVKQSGLEPITAQSLLTAYRPYFTEVQRLLDEAKEVEVTDATQVTLIKKARELRLKLAKQRVAADKKREELKEDSKRQGNAIQGIFNVLKFMTEPVEEKLLAAEEFAERAEAKRLSDRKAARIMALKPFGVDPTFYDLTNMPEPHFATMLAGARDAFEKAEAAKLKAEQDRIAKETADREAAERVAAENQRLREEAAAAAKQAEIERADRLAREKEAEAALAAERAAREKVEADAKAAREVAEKQAQEEIARKEREAGERIERELAEQRRRNQEAIDIQRRKHEEEMKAAYEKARLEREKADAEAAKRAAEQSAALEKARVEREASAKKAKADQLAALEARKRAEDAAAKAEKDAAELRAQQQRIADEAAAAEKTRKALAAGPDREKLTALAATIRAIELPTLTSDAGKVIAGQVGNQVEKFALWIDKQAATL